MPTIEGPITECLKCGGPLWDNRQNKKSPKGPDFKCRDKACDEAYWLPKQSAPKPSFAKPAPAPQVAAGTRDDDLTALFWDSFDKVIAGLRERKLTDLFVGKEVAALTATLFIQRAKG